MGPEVLNDVLSTLPSVEDKNLIVGFDKSDDAAVYKLTDEIAMIQTLDFFTPMVDDPYIFGQIAAANSLSDVYAMGGTPKTAMNIVCFPEKMDINILGEVLRGGAEKVAEAGAVLSGGHSIHDPEIKYGLSVTGIAHPDKILKNHGCQNGDILICTKKLGTGIVTTASKVGLASENAINTSIKNMTTLNKYAGEIIVKYPVTACTDITGFGFLGHAYEMASNSNKTLIFEKDFIPFIEEAKGYAQDFLITTGGQKNRNFVANNVDFQNVPLWLQEILFDPQTSGGLLFSIPAQYVSDLMKEFSSANIDAVIIGSVVEKEKKFIIVR
ncbi:selenide, water dikinase SelD [uncultured Fusobacterium sp.]|uniref:selenide, water dikinase SelD n=1 Tax=uncultured Fusobacterium sp. TaxID=159267 RepID=UPI0035A63DCB